MRGKVARLPPVQCRRELLSPSPCSPGAGSGTPREVLVLNPPAARSSRSKPFQLAARPHVQFDSPAFFDFTEFFGKCCRRCRRARDGVLSVLDNLLDYDICHFNLLLHIEESTRLRSAAVPQIRDIARQAKVQKPKCIVVVTAVMGPGNSSPHSAV